MANISRDKDIEKSQPSSEPPSLQSEKAVLKDDPEFLVRFEEGDPENPLNFNTYAKAWYAFQMGLLAVAGSFGSSIIAPAEGDLVKYLGVSQEVTVLTVALFVLGYAFGPLLWAPVSEVYGRKVSMLPPVFVLGLFSIGTAVSKNTASVLATRFLGGIFASAPVSNVSAALGDMYAPRVRGIPMSLLAVCVVGGPTIAPIVGAAIVINPHLSWRWTEYIQAILTFAIFAITLFCMPETYAPVLLKRKAARLRKATGDERHWHPQQNVKMSPSNIVTKFVSRPLRMLFTEPMVTCIALYASFVYGLLFLTLEVFPIVFYEQRQYGLLVSTLPFLGLFIGVVCALTINLANQPRYAKAVAANKGRAVPEARLPPMIIGGFLFTSGLFWFGWTADPRISWVSPVFAAGFIGAGFNIIFQQCLNFLVDSYGPYAASATSANTFLRSLLACGLPMAARPMFLNMGVGPAASVLGGVSCLALPIPWLFMRYSLRLRKMSKFAPVPQD